MHKGQETGPHFTRLTDETCLVLDPRRAVTLTFTAIWKPTPGKSWSDICKVPLGRRRYVGENRGAVPFRWVITTSLLVSRERDAFLSVVPRCARCSAANARPPTCRRNSYQAVPRECD